MPAPGVMIDRVRAKVVSTTGGAIPQPSSLTQTDPRNRIIPGQMAYQLRPMLSKIQLGDVNKLQLLLTVELTVKFRLSAGMAERDYVDNQMLVLSSALVDPEWWRTIAGVSHVEGLPAATLPENARIGDVIAFKVSAAIAFVAA